MWYIVVFQPSKSKKFHFQPQIWFDLTHFPKWLRKSAKSQLYKLKKTQKFWVNSEILSRVESLIYAQLIWEPRMLFMIGNDKADLTKLLRFEI